MREKLYLLLFGSLLGIGLGLGAGWGLSSLRSKLAVNQEGASFESVEDFRSAMLERDDRDVKPDRSVSLRSIIQPHPSDRIIYELRPNLDVRFQGVPVRTNSHGMRGREIPIAKPRDVYRIALLGDSFAFGWGVEEEKIFPVVLESMLNAALPEGPRVEVLNFGVPGYATFQEVAQFEEKVLPFEPDAVLVYFIDNDFGLPFFIRNFKNPEKLTGSDQFHKFKKKGSATEADAKKLWGFLNPNAWLKRLSEHCTERSISLAVAINPRKSWEKDYNNLWVLRSIPEIRHIALREGFLEKVTSQQIDPKTLVLPNDPHPSEVKHRLLAELFTEAYLPSIEGALKAPAVEKLDPLNGNSEAQIQEQETASLEETDSLEETVVE